MKIRNIVSLLLVIVLSLSLLPLSVIASEPTLIESFDIILDETLCPKPVAEESTYRGPEVIDAMFEGMNVHAVKVYWICTDIRGNEVKWTFDTRGVTFNRQTTYYIRMQIAPNDGYKLSRDCWDNYLLNGMHFAMAMGCEDGDETMTLEWNFGTTEPLYIDGGFNLPIDLDALGLPVAGETAYRANAQELADNAVSFYDWCGFAELSWKTSANFSEGYNFSMNDESATLLSGETYYLSILLRSTAEAFDESNIPLYTMNNQSPVGYFMYNDFAVSLIYALPVKCGDINGDTTLDALDYALLKRAVLGTYEMSGDAMSYADINKDDNIDALDYALLKRAVLGTYTIEQ